ALGAQLVRAHPPAGLRGRPQLRRLLDRVGQRRAPADRAGHRAGRGPRPMTDTAASDAGLPAAFAEIADDFHALPGRDRLQLLLDSSIDRPALPDRCAAPPELREPVPERQSPTFPPTAAEGTGRDAPARLLCSAPAEAPTPRAFA